jgi:hypothetical protein
MARQKDINKSKKFTLSIVGDTAINKLVETGRKSGKYVSTLIDRDVYGEITLTEADKEWIRKEIASFLPR